MSDSHTVTIDEAELGQRLDKTLARALPDVSRARLQALIEGGAVMRDGAPCTNSATKVKPGETYALRIPTVTALDLTPSAIALNVVYEDDDIIIINKPAGMTVHPAAGTRGDTLVHALLGHCGGTLSGIGGVARPGIVHRIDKETSGLLAVAKHDFAHAHLSAQLKARTLKRTYIAYLWGALTPRNGTIDAPIARNTRHRRQMGVFEGGRDSVTHYDTIATYHAAGNITPLATKVMVELETGRTHQIRVHMTHAKCPLIGDPIYGMSTAAKLNRVRSGGLTLPEPVIATLNLLHRQALHAQELVLTHPKTNESMHFTCPLPDDLTALETALDSLTIRA
ncbi:MAG: RluA family pseudouridine synthase [Pseudomonadota bacterium]